MGHETHIASLHSIHAITILRDNIPIKRVNIEYNDIIDYFKVYSK